MLKRFILTLSLGAAVGLLLPAVSEAQRTGVTVTTVANLPATCEPKGHPYVVADGLTSSDCATGGGSVTHWCFCNAGGNGYDAQPGGTPDPDSVGTTELNDGTDTPLTSQLVAVDSASTAQFEYLAIGLGLVNDGDTFKIDWAQTLAGDPALNADELIFVATASGGGFLAEGSAADTNEMLFLFPDLNEADTTHEITTNSAIQTLTNKTLTTPTIGSFTNAGHDHSNAAGGGDVALGAGSTGTTATKGDNDTSLATTAFVQGEIRLIKDWDAFEIYTDGTRCKSPVVKQLNSGPFSGTIDCDDNASSVLYGHVRLADYEGGTLVFNLRATNRNATPSGVIDFDFSAMCRGDADLIDATWGTAQSAAITFATQWLLEHAATAAVTPNGTCAAGDTLYWRAVLDDVATTTQVADVEILGVDVKEQ